MRNERGNNNPLYDNYPSKQSLLYYWCYSQITIRHPFFGKVKVVTGDSFFLSLAVSGRRLTAVHARMQRTAL
jgi:hypothetical protein